MFNLVRIRKREKRFRNEDVKNKELNETSIYCNR